MTMQNEQPERRREAAVKKKASKRLKRGNSRVTISYVRHDVIRKRRKQLGLTLREAAMRAGMSSHVQWVAVESGKNVDLQLSTLCRIAAALEVEPAALSSALAAVRREGR